MKEAMKLGNLRIRNQVNDLKRERKGFANERNHLAVNRIDSKIEQLEREKVHYRAAVIPVQFSNGVVINGTLLKTYVKKLPVRAITEAEITRDFIKVHYTSPKGSGSFTLINNAQRYTGLNLDFPSGENLLDELGIYLKG